MRELPPVRTHNSKAPAAEPAAAATGLEVEWTPELVEQLVVARRAVNSRVGLDWIDNQQRLQLIQAEMGTGISLTQVLYLMLCSAFSCPMACLSSLAHCT